MERNDWILIINLSVAYAVFLIDVAIYYLPEWSSRKLNIKQLGLPFWTPVGTRPQDCLIGTTAILTHLVEDAISSSTEQVHGVAESVLSKYGHQSGWDSFLTTGTYARTMGIWHHVLLRLELPLPRELEYSYNHELAGKGVLVMSDLSVAHAVAYADGLVSDPSRPLRSPTWEKLATALKRYPGMVPTKVHILEDCSEGAIGFVPYGAHRCTYQFAK